MVTSRRRLPHEYPEDTWLFVTWSLNGSLPSERFPPPEKVTSGEAFLLVDRFLDATPQGPKYLTQERPARIVLAALNKGVELGHYDLRAWVIMPNHVHVLLLPKTAPNLLLRALKGASAREANRALGLTGTSFWQKESYDHWVRDTVEFNRIVRYIENNPVKAGLVSRMEEYLWSSAGVETSLDAARTSACATRERDIGAQNER